MSEAVRAAVAARRTAARSHRKQDDLPSSEPAISIAQAPLSRALIASCQTGKLHIAARSPPLTELPPDVWRLVDGPEPAWYADARGADLQPWYARPDVASLNASSNELAMLDERIGLLRALERLELHNNLIGSIPLNVLSLEHLTIVNLANNRLTAFPTALLALDLLHTLDLSGNQLTALWSASDVLAARSEKKRLRHEFETEHGPVQEDGMWTAFLSAPHSPIKRNQGRLAPDVPLPPTTALHKLRVLKLARNRLTNRSLGLGVTNSSDKEDTGFAFPARLRLLDLSTNNIRAPLSVSAFSGLNQLQELRLDHTGMFDQVFAPPSTEDPDQGQAALPSLSLLTLDATDMNDLSTIEAQFSSNPSLTSTPSFVPQLTVSTPWLVPKQIVRIRGSEKPPLDAPDGLVYITLEGCPLVEENMKRRRAHAPRMPAVPVASPMAAGAGKVHQSPTRPATLPQDEFGPLGSTPRKVQATTEVSIASPTHAAAERDFEGFEPLGTPSRTTRRGRALAQPTDEWKSLGSLTPSPSHRTRPRPVVDEFGPLGGMPTPPRRSPSRSGSDGPPASPTTSLEPTKASRPSHGTPHRVDDWESMAAQAPLTEGQKRMLRIAAARKEGERLAAAHQNDKKEDHLPVT